MAYDAGKAFARIEDQLIDSMMRNLKRHLAEENAEGFDWSQWQTEQLRYLEEYRRKNAKTFGLQFDSINRKMQQAIAEAEAQGQKAEELNILRALAQSKSLQRRKAAEAAVQGAGDAFFRVNDRKLGSSLSAAQNDLQRAEYAILRRSNDQYRKIIFDAQMYANTGAGTVQQAVDMATKDFLSRGIDSIVYKNGARHTISDYADMYVRTAERRAYLMGEGQKRQEWGEQLVIVNKRGGQPCPQCQKWIGKILVDDVYSGGKPDGKHTLLSEAMAEGFLHPRCKDGFTTYFPGISSAPDPVTKREMKAAVKAEQEENQENYAARQAEKYGRLAQYSLDPENRRRYQARAEEWKKVYREEPIEKQEKPDIIKNIQLPPGLSEVSGMTEEIQAEIGKAMDTLKEQYRISLDRIGLESLGSGYETTPFQYQPMNLGGFLSSRIVINADYNFNDSLEAYEARIMRNYNRGVLAAKNIEDLLAHELAHVMTFQDCERYSVFLERESEVRIAFVRGISDYADSTYDGAESIAEAFVRKRNGEPIPVAAEDLLRKYIERWRR